MNLLWVARAPAPYRYPVWSEIAKEVDLTVAFLHPTGLGRDWGVRDSVNFRQQVLPTRGIPYRGDALWVLSPHAFRSLRQSPDAIVFQGAWETPAFWQVLRFANRVGAKKVLFYESTLSSMRHQRWPVSAARTRFFHQMDHIITPGCSATRAVVAHGIKSSRILTSVNVVDVDWWRETITRARLHAEGLPRRGGHHFIGVSQLIGRKNLPSMIRAFDIARRPLDRLTISGSGRDLSSLIELVDFLDLGGVVEFVGHLSPTDLACAYASAQTLVLPSTEEVWGLVVNEALAGGLHVVVSERAGVAASVVGMEGVYLSLPTVESLVRAMAMSRRDYVGPIAEPAIMDHGAKRLAGDILSVL